MDIYEKMNVNFIYCLNSDNSEGLICLFLRQKDQGFVELGGKLEGLWCLSSHGEYTEKGRKMGSDPYF